MRLLPLCLAVCFAAWYEPAKAQPRPQGSDKPMMTLVEELKSGYPVTKRIQAAEALVGYGRSAAVPVAKLLRSDDSRTRYYACFALCRLGPYAEAAVPDLTAIAADPNDPPLRRVAVHALERVGPAASPATPVLCKLLSENNWELEDCAIRALAGIGKNAVPTMVENLRSGDSAMCQSLCAALQQMGTEAQDAVPTLVSLVSEIEGDPREAAFLALAAIGPPAVGDLTRMLGHADGQVRRLAAMAISRIGVDAAPAIPALRDAVRDSDADVRFWVIHALGEIGNSDNDTSACLARAALDEDADVRWQAVVALRKTGIGESGERALSALFNDPHPAVRAEAKAALGHN